MSLSAAGVLSFKVSINGKEILALLDTGSSAIVVDQRLVSDLGIQAEGSGLINATGGAIRSANAAHVRLAFGQADRPDSRIQIGDLTSLNAARRTQFGAIVGTSVFGQGTLELDFQRMRFRVLQSAPAATDAKFVAMEIVTGVPVVTIALGGTLNRRIMLDTGKDGDLALTDGTFENLAKPTIPTTDLARGGLGGISVARLTVLPSLSFQGFRINEVALEAESEDPFIKRLGVDGIAGTHLLQRFNLVLDFVTRKVSITPSGVAVVPIVKSTSGLQIAYGPAAGEVMHVMKGSPAARGGWKVHDRVCSIDGQPVAIVGASAVLKAWGTDRPGRTINFAMCDGQKRELTLAKFY